MAPRWNKKNAFARKIQRFWRNRRKYKRYKRPARVRTGSLTIRQKVADQITLPAGPAPNGFYRNVTFNIAGLPNIAEFQRLFDQYRINAVSYTIMPVTQDPAFPSNQSLTFASSIDLDGNNAPIASVPEMLQRANCKTSPFSSQGGMIPYKKIYLKPRWNDIIVKSKLPALTDAVALGNRKTWLDINYPDIQHYGLDLMWWNQDLQLNNEIVMDVIVTYYLQFRKVK